MMINLGLIRSPPFPHAQDICKHLFKHLVATDWITRVRRVVAYHCALHLKLFPLNNTIVYTISVLVDGTYMSLYDYIIEG